MSALRVSSCLALAVIGLALLAEGCWFPVASSADAGVSDAHEADAPFICEPRDECPVGCSWTPCGCATDNPAVSCNE